MTAMERMTFTAEGEASEVLDGLNLGYLYFTGVGNSRSNPEVDRIIDGACRNTISRFSVKETAHDPTIKGVRRFFSGLGIDPTRTRPSGEALIKRVVEGKGLYRVNAVVDVNNAVSIETGCPCGVYDASKLAGTAITVKIGSPGQTYEGIGGNQVNGEGRILTADSKGVFGGPVADSRRTSITLETKEVLMLIYHPESAPVEVLTKGMDKASGYMEVSTGAKTEYSGIYRIRG
jgi:DNA/RNA-binding domain of Phe-tRNA-synthetase-like protein